MNCKELYIEVHGCPANVADYEISLGLLQEAGFKFTNLKQSKLNLIFTCNVKSASSQKMIHRIRELTNLRKPLIVAGCMPKTERKAIEKINPKASLLGPDSIQKIVDVVQRTLNGEKVVCLEDLRKPKLCLPRVRRNPIIGIIPISIGCLGNCSFCIVKFAKGKLFSYPIKLILKEARKAIKNGCKELWITSQGNACWGLDIGSRLPKLLKEICKIKGNFFVRVGMMNPQWVKLILDDLIEVYKNEKIFKFLHLPLESGSDDILKLMNRGYKVEDFLEIVERFREEIPSLTLSTDIIVGFPSESNRDFEATVKIIKEVKPDVVNLSKFGPKPGTKAAKLKQLDPQIIKKRSRELHDLIKTVRLQCNRKWVGWGGEVLIDERGKDGFIARNFAYKPIVIPASKNLFGEFVKVKIVKAKSNYLVGRIGN